MMTAVRQGTWMDKERFKKTCIQESEKKGSIHLRTCVSNFMLRQDAGGLMLEKYLSDKTKSMEAKRTFGARDGCGRNCASSQSAN